MASSEAEKGTKKAEEKQFGREMGGEVWTGARWDRDLVMRRKRLNFTLRIIQPRLFSVVKSFCSALQKFSCCHYLCNVWVLFSTVVGNTCQISLACSSFLPFDFSDGGVIAQVNILFCGCFLAWLFLIYIERFSLCLGCIYTEDVFCTYARDGKRKGEEGRERKRKKGNCLC